VWTVSKEGHTVSVDGQYRGTFSVDGRYRGTLSVDSPYRGTMSECGRSVQRDIQCGCLVQ